MATPQKNKSDESRPAEPSFSPAPGQPKPATFSEEIKNYLREQDREGNERLRWLLDRFCAEDPKAAFQCLVPYAFGKPTEGSERSNTVAGVPEKFIELFRQYAREL